MKNRADLIFSLVILVAGLLVFLKSHAFPDLPEGHPGPGLFPAYIGGGLFICGLFLFINSFRIKIANRVDFSGSWTPVILILLLMIVFPFAYNLLGFFPVIAVAILLVGFLLKLRLISALLTSVITTGFIYLIFNQILHVPL